MTPPDLHQPLMASLLAGGFMAAFLHAALPTHWLPFVLVGRAQGWRMIQVLGAVVLAGLAHIATTALVGSLIVGAGLMLDTWVDGLLPWLSASLLIGLGLFYLVRSLRHRQTLTTTGDAALMGNRTQSGVSDRAAFWGLVGMLAITPGEVLLPYYLGQANDGTLALGLLTLVFAVGTVLGMTVFTVLAWQGWTLLRLERWARYEGVALGLALIAIGVLVLTHRH